jgi:hypothetical protein
VFAALACAAAVAVTAGDSGVLALAPALLVALAVSRRRYPGPHARAGSRRSARPAGRC